MFKSCTRFERVWFPTQYLLGGGLPVIPIRRGIPADKPLIYLAKRMSMCQTTR